MTIQGAHYEIVKWELPFYCEPAREKVLETIEEYFDAVPVVRCEDCKHHDTVSLNCEFLAATTLDQWYCWNGERRA